MPFYYTNCCQHRSASRGAMPAVLLTGLATIHAGAVTVVTDIDEWRVSGEGGS